MGKSVNTIFQFQLKKNEILKYEILFMLLKNGAKVQPFVGSIFRRNLTLLLNFNAF